MYLHISKISNFFCFCFNLYRNYLYRITLFVFSADYFDYGKELPLVFVLNTFMFFCFYNYLYLIYDTTRRVHFILLLLLFLSVSSFMQDIVLWAGFLMNKVKFIGFIFIDICIILMCLF